MNVALFRKTWRDHWKSLIAWNAVIVFMSAVELSVYPTMVKAGTGFSDLLKNLPDAMQKVFRMQDYTSGPGFLSTELFSLMFPLIFIVVGATWGVAATAEEEEKGTADLLFSLPISRTKILLTKMAATWSVALFMGAVAFFTLLIGSPMAKLTIDTSHLFAASCQMVFLSVFVAGVGFVVGTLTGRKGVSLGLTSGLMLLEFLFYSLAPLVDNFKFLTPVNPFEWALGGDPLFNGFDLTGAAKLLVMAAIFHFLAAMRLNKKDIRNP